MHNDGVREHRLAERILQQLAIAIHERCRDPGLTRVTLTDARVSSDLSWADIYFALPLQGPSAEEVLKAFRRSNSFLRREIAGSWKGMRVPQLRFHLDDSQERAQKIDELLRSDKPSDS